MDFNPIGLVGRAYRNRFTQQQQTHGSTAAAELTKAVARELFERGYRLAPANNPRSGFTFELGVLLAPGGARVQMLEDIGGANTPIWRALERQAVDVDAGAALAPHVDNADDRVFAASERSAVLERLERLIAYGAEHRGALERVLAAVVDVRPARRRRLVVRVFGWSLVLEHERIDDGQSTAAAKTSSVDYRVRSRARGELHRSPRA
jgi:hypothetical protein